MSVQNQVKGVTSWWVGKVTAWSRPKSSSSADRRTARGLVGGINMNVEISDDEEAAFHGVAVFKEVGGIVGRKESQ